jgi:hypothetical protein
MSESMKERKLSLLRRASSVGLEVRTHAPDGTTIYKFFDRSNVDMATLDYFSDVCLGRCRGLSQAEVWLDGYVTAFCMHAR